MINMRLTKFTPLPLLLMYFLSLAACSYMTRNDAHVVYGQASVGKDRFIRFQGHNIHYVETDTAGKQKETMLLIPGAFSTYRSWDRMIPLLAKHYRILAIDYLGAGDSDKPTAGFAYKIEEQADMIAGMMQQTGITSAHIVGVSYGGLIALNLATRYPHRATSVVCIEGGVVKPEKLPYYYWRKMLGWPFIGDFFVGAVRSGLFDTITAKAVMGEAWKTLTREEQEEIVVILTQSNKTASRKAWYRISQTFENSKDFVEEIKSLKTPVLYIYGEKSELRTMSEMNVRFFKQYLPAVEIISFQDGIHDLELQKPREVANLIITFLGGNGNEIAASRRADAEAIPTPIATP
jgi:pimeloyl-ACP methyl ester carboxylesterase